MDTLDNGAKFQSTVHPPSRASSPILEKWDREYYAKTTKCMLKSMLHVAMRSKITTQQHTFSTGLSKKYWEATSSRLALLSKIRQLRFDFSHHKPVSLTELRDIENLVNEKMRTDQAVETYELPYQDAQKRNDIKQFFGEKYGEKVRVVDADFSKELCGGTHTTRTGTIGLFKISKESSIAAGVRRIEAVTGRFAEQLVQGEEDLLHSLGTLLKVPAQSVQDKVQDLLDENRLLTQELKVLRKGQLKTLLAQCLSSKENVGMISLVALEVQVQAEELNEFANDLLSQMKSGVVALGMTIGERCQLLVAVSPDLVQKNVHAQMLIKEAAPLIQGGGGGKQNMAQAGGKDPQGLPKALDKIRHLLKDVK